MIYKDIDSYHNAFFEHLRFDEFKTDFYTQYCNSDKPELGKIYCFSRDKDYKIFVCNYTVEETFALKSDVSEPHVQLSFILGGKPEYQLNHDSETSFCPKSFYVMGRKRKGCQIWNANEHYHAVAVLIRENYFLDFLDERYGGHCISLQDMTPNRLYKTLPESLLNIIQNIEYNTNIGRVTPIYIESEILKMVAELTAIYHKDVLMSATDRFKPIRISIGGGKYLIFSESEQAALFEAHNILANEYYYPPTIEDLAFRVGLSTQKLKRGFVHMFHETMHQYTCSIRMAVSCDLLCETNESIGAIAGRVGYKNCSKFSDMFKRRYGDTPLKYREKHRKESETSAVKNTLKRKNAQAREA